MYISLGYNCKPRIQMKNNLGLSKATGYQSCPFDLCITPFESLCQCIETDFEHFFKDLRTIPWGSDKNAIMNSYDMIFNHEGSSHAHLFKVETNDELYYIRNDFEKFKERYKARIDNFRRYISTCNKITFIIKLDKGNENIGILTNLLNKKFHGKSLTVIYGT